MRRFLFAAVAVALFAAPAPAADSPLNWTQVVRPAVDNHAFEWGLFVLGFVVVVFVIERVIALGLCRGSFAPPLAVAHAVEAARTNPEGLVPALRKVAAEYLGPYSTVLSKVLDAASSPFRVMAEVLTATVSVEEDRASQATHYLTLIARVAPFAGLIGTVCGIMVSLDGSGGEARNETVSRGLAAALTSTALGVVVAAVSTAAACVSRQQTKSLFLRLRQSLGELLPLLSGR
jgi:biopolymer transport protein ExbB/TolQ